MEAEIIGGEEAEELGNKHEAALRKAEQELISRKKKEHALARLMEEKEDEKMEIEGKYTSLNEEVEAKTKKLKKLCTKFRRSQTEIKDLQQEFQSERDEMLDSIRELDKQVKLKELVISSFIPPEFARKFDDKNNGGSAAWDEDAQRWSIPLAEPRKKVNNTQRLAGLNGSFLPETDYARRRRQYDPDTRYRQENVIELELNMPKRTTEKYTEPDMITRAMKLIDEQIFCDDPRSNPLLPVDEPIKNPYLHYSSDENSTADSKRNSNSKCRPATSKTRKESTKQHDRPSTARYRGRSDRETKKKVEKKFPTARGLVE